MSASRDAVLRNVRRSLGRDGALPASAAEGLAAQLRRPASRPRPKVDEPLIERFVAKLRAVNVTVTRLPDLQGVSAAVAQHLDAHGLGSTLVVAPDPDLAAIHWSNRLRIERRAARGDDRVSVTSAFAGIAETGTLVLLSGPRSPTTLNFLPGDHLVVLAAERVLAAMEEVWARLRCARDTMPRTVNLITGPSRTADIEQTLQEGAHGPRRLHLLLIGEPDARTAPA